MEDFQKQLLGEQDDLDYFDIGSPEKIVVSSSIIGNINPEEGGSPKKFMNALEYKDEKKSKSLETGTLLHDWQERRDDFIIAEFEKPSDNIAKVIENLFYKNKDYFKANGFDWITLTPELIKISAELNYGQSWKPETLIKKIEDGRGKEYLTHLINADGKTAITAATAEKLNNCIESIKNHPSANKYLNKSDFDDNCTLLKEVVVIWKTPIDINGVVVDLLNKSKLDVVKIFLKDRLVQVTDLKTTSSSVYLFYKGAYRYYRYYRQGAFYIEAVKQLLAELHPDINYKEWKIEFYNVVVETVNNFECQVWKANDFDLKQGAKEIESLRKRICTHIATSNWKTPLEFTNVDYLEIPLPIDALIDELMDETTDTSIY